MITPFVIGPGQFESWLTLKVGRFRERHWPVFARNKRRRRKRVIPSTALAMRTIRSIKREAKIAEVRRWEPCNPLAAHAMRVEDAWRAKYNAGR